jgi:apolipoprotein N-acyltransferase
VKPRVFLPAILSGVLLWAASFPLDLGPLGFVALVPWLTLVRAPVSNRQRYFAAYVGGATFFALATQWVRVAHPMMYMSWLGLTVVMPLFWLVALALLRRLDKLGVPLAVAAPVAWVALEYCRMHFPTGFPFMKHLGAYQMIGFGWYFLGYTQHAFAQLVQIADLGGVYAVSFVVASVNGALAGAAVQLPAVRRALRWEESPEPCCGKRCAVGGGLAVGLLCASVGYGFYRLDHAAFTDGPLVAAIQGNVSQGDKMERGGTLKQQYSLAHQLAFRQKPDLLVWPETCYWEDWYELAPGVGHDSVPERFAPDVLRSKQEFGFYWGTNVLFGLSGHEWDGARMWKYNSALLTDPDGLTFTRYDKMHLVPFGEYVPLGEQLPFMKWFTPYKHDYSCRPGEKWTRFQLKTKDGRQFTFGCLICYEDSDTYLARQYVAAEPVNFLVNISNDGWFDGTEEHEQHLAICRFRAVEARRSVVRAVNMGVSAVIDPDGRVVALPRRIEIDGKTASLSEHPLTGWSASKKVQGVVVAAVPIDTRSSPYAALGDWVPALCWGAALVALVLTWRTPPARAVGGG